MIADLQRYAAIMFLYNNYHCGKLEDIKLYIYIEGNNFHCGKLQNIKKLHIYVGPMIAGNKYHCGKLENIKSCISL